MTNAFAINGVCRPADAVTAASDLLRSDSFQAAGVNGRVDLISRAPCIGARIHQSLAGLRSIVISIASGHLQPIGAAVRP